MEGGWEDGRQTDSHFRTGPIRSATIMAVLFASSLTYLAFAVLAILFALLKLLEGHGGEREMPGPRRWPILGNLHLLRGYDVPYQAFVHLSRKFGDVFSLQLGTVPAVVVQGVDNIREVLVHKSHHFDSRPNFNRYHQLFHGDKENSLAFCDWSNVQKKRRDLLKDHVFPKVYTNSYQTLNRLIGEEINKMIEDIKDTANNNTRAEVHKKEMKKTGLDAAGNSDGVQQREESLGGPQNHISIKDRILPTCANIFLRYFCSENLEEDEELREFVENFDKIFYEVNQGYAYDFLPFLSIFYQKDIQKVQKHSENIRKFVLKNIIKDRMEEIDEDFPERDYVDALLKNVKFGKDANFNMETALFSLEDIIGGHSAIGNFLVKLLTFLVDNREVQGRIREEVEARKKPFVTLDDRMHMPYTEAVVMEALRMLSSPIVPHVSNQDTTIAGFPVKKDTLVFLNNYELNMSESLWTNPREFDPTRFINPDTGTKAKPAHFLPFGGGKRSCMGYKLVQFVSFVFLANAVSNFDICSVPETQDLQEGGGGMESKEEEFAKLVSKSIPTWTSVWNTLFVENRALREHTYDRGDPAELEEKIVKKISELVREEEALLNLYKKAAEVAKENEEDYRGKTAFLLKQIQKDRNLLKMLQRKN